jgi:UDP-N-acetyl-2-amino-2-deoxyglucuronate dehydrogenase
MSLGFGIAGLGTVAETHAKAIGDMENGHLSACFSRSKNKAEAFAERHRCTPYWDYAAFLEDRAVDIVTICTPSGAHLKPAVEAAAVGKHIIVEKPLEITLDRIDHIIERCREEGVLCSGVFQSRFSPAAGAVRKAVEQARFGMLTLGSASVKWYRSRQYYDEGGWHGTWDLDGGGALMNQSIHAVDLLQWYMGPVETVSAMTGTLGHKNIEVEDTAVVTLRFQNGALGTVEGSTACYPGFLKRVELSGTAGSAVLEEDTITVWQFDPPRPEDETVLQNLGPGAGAAAGGGASDPAAIDYAGHRIQFENFARAVRSGGPPLVDGTEARKAVEIILAVYKSASENRPVSLPL